MSYGSLKISKKPPIKNQLLTLDPKIIIYNRVQKCGSRSVLQAVRPILEFNKVPFIARELKFYLSDDEKSKFANEIDKLLTSNKRNFYAQHIHFQNLTSKPVTVFCDCSLNL